MKELKSGWWAVDVLDVEKNFPQFLGKIAGAFEVLDDLGVLNEVEVKVEVWSGSGSGGAHGAYDPGGRLIKVFEDGMVAGYGEMTLIHEYGHHLTVSDGEDQAGFLLKVMNDDKLFAWWNSVCRTSVYKRLDKVKRNTEEPWKVRDYASYLNDPREVFARCFAQWVMDRSGVAELEIQHLANMVNTAGVFGWSDEEFVDVASCLDKMFGV